MVLRTGRCAGRIQFGETGRIAPALERDLELLLETVMKRPSRDEGRD